MKKLAAISKDTEQLPIWSHQSAVLAVAEILVYVCLLLLAYGPKCSGYLDKDSLYPSTISLSFTYEESQDAVFVYCARGRREILGS
jgi:hypothetical protein